MVEAYNRYLAQTPFTAEYLLELPPFPNLPCQPDPGLVSEIRRMAGLAA